MAIVRMKLSEIRRVVKKIVNEEMNGDPSNQTKSGLFFDYILQGSDATEENARNAAMGLDWGAVDTEMESYPNLDYIDTMNGVGIYYNWKADYYCFTDESQDQAEY